jgi:hypothetical protein
MKEDTTPIDSTWMEKTGGFAKDMTLRDYYAGLAMQACALGWIARGDYPSSDEITADCAYGLADAMLRARAK